jgi:hypothetical protein
MRRVSEDVLTAWDTHEVHLGPYVKWNLLQANTAETSGVFSPPPPSIYLTDSFLELSKGFKGFNLGQT